MINVIKKSRANDIRVFRSWIMISVNLALKVYNMTPSFRCGIKLFVKVNLLICSIRKLIWKRLNCEYYFIKKIIYKNLD